MQHDFRRRNKGYNKGYYENDIRQLSHIHEDVRLYQNFFKFFIPTFKEKYPPTLLLYCPNHKTKVMTL